MKITKADITLFKRLQKSPVFFVEKMWGLKPQPILPGYKDEIKNFIENKQFDSIQSGHFGDFEKGKHITWQQWVILLTVEEAVRGGKSRISIASAHGIGKSCTMSWIILWYLFCHKDAQVPCTAPTSDQMHDVLWKEIALWIGRMPQWARDKYDWTTGYLRITERPETWFARAKTARKESPEALAGVHGDYVCFCIDESSGVPEEIFNTAEGALTSGNILVIMISNPTRLIGYFYDSHHGDRENWQTLQFNCIDSPIVDWSYVDRIAQKHGEDSDEYRVRVLGLFPKEDTLDDKGYVALLNKSDLRYTMADYFVGSPKMGIDPAGEGNDTTRWVIRDNFKAIAVAKEKTSNPASIAQKTITLIDKYDIDPGDVYVDNFGIGANIAQEIALVPGKTIRINAVNVGEKADDDKVYTNKKAEAFIRLKEWIRKGGELSENKDWEELLTIRYRREINGKLKIMGKQEMRKEGYGSPDLADALSLTFLGSQAQTHIAKKQEEMNRQEAKEAFDPHSVI